MRLGVLTSKIPMHLKRAFYDNCPIEVEMRVFDRDAPEGSIYLVKVQNHEENTEQAFFGTLFK